MEIWDRFSGHMGGEICHFKLLNYRYLTIMWWKRTQFSNSTFWRLVVQNSSPTRLRLVGDEFWTTHVRTPVSKMFWWRTCNIRHCSFILTGRYRLLFQIVNKICISSKRVGRWFILTWVLLVYPPLNFFQTLLSLGGGGGVCGGHTYSVLCTVWATIWPGCSVVYMGHVIPYDARNTSSACMAGTGYIYIGIGPRVRS